MSVSLLQLPIELVDHIIRFCDDQSLLELRKVCNMTKALAETTVLHGSSPPDIDNLELSAQEINCKASFELILEEKRLRCKLFIVSAINYLQVPGIAYYSKKISATMTLAEVYSFFDALSPFIGNAKIPSLHVFPSKPETFLLISPFLKGRFAHGLEFVVDESQQSRQFLLQLIDRLQATAVKIKFTAAFDGPFLLKLAELVDALIVVAPITLQEFLTEYIRNLVCDILGNRCAYLDMCQTSIDIPLNEAIILAEFLKTIPGKEIGFFAPSSNKFDYVEATTDYKIKIAKKKGSMDQYEVDIRII